jgi:hypothetical protein
MDLLDRTHFVSNFIDRIEQIERQLDDLSRNALINAQDSPVLELTGLGTTPNASIKWDSAEGKFEVQGELVTQVEINADGQVIAGAGAVTIDSNGIVIEQGANDYNRIRFDNAGTEQASIGVWSTGETQLKSIGSTGRLDILANKNNDSAKGNTIRLKSDDYSLWYGQPNYGLGIGTNSSSNDYFLFTNARVLIDHGDQIGNISTVDVQSNTFTVRLTDLAGTDYVEIQDNSADPLLHVGSDGRVGINVSAEAGTLHVKQYSAAGAIPVLYLHQLDVDQPFIQFVGGTVYTGKSAQDEYIKVVFGGNTRYLRCYS